MQMRINKGPFVITEFSGTTASIIAQSELKTKGHMLPRVMQKLLWTLLLALIR